VKTWRAFRTPDIAINLNRFVERLLAVSGADHVFLVLLS